MEGERSTLEVLIMVSKHSVDAALSCGWVLCGYYLRQTTFLPLKELLTSTGQTARKKHGQCHKRPVPLLQGTAALPQGRAQAAPGQT